MLILKSIRSDGQEHDPDRLAQEFDLIPMNGSTVLDRKVTDMSEPDSYVLFMKSYAPLISQQLVLMKTAVMFSLTSLQGEHRVEFAPAVARKIKDEILPENCWVDLAYSKFSTAVGGAITRCFRVINGGKYNPSQVIRNGDGFKFYVQFNHLLLRIAQAPGANVTYLRTVVSVKRKDVKAAVEEFIQAEEPRTMAVPACRRKRFQR